MCNHERIYEIEKILDILDKRIDKLINRKTTGATNGIINESIINSLEIKRAKLESELHRLTETNI